MVITVKNENLQNAIKIFREHCRFKRLVIGVKKLTIKEGDLIIGGAVAKNDEETIFILDKYYEGLDEAMKDVAIEVEKDATIKTLNINSLNYILIEGMDVYKYHGKNNKKDKPVSETSSGTYDRSICPPLLSTTHVDVNVLFPDNNRYMYPDQVQVVLFALTKVWSDSRRIKVNPDVKKYTKTYVKFAYGQMLTNKYIKDNPKVYESLKPKAMRVTKDCCIEIDFEVQGLSGVNPNRTRCDI